MRVLLAMILLLAIVGICVAQINPDDFKAAFNTNRAKWATKAPLAYKFTQKRYTGDTRGPFDVTVYRGVLATVCFAPGSGFTGSPKSRDGLFTVDQAFDRVQEILDMNPPAALLNVYYHPVMGHITWFSARTSSQSSDEDEGANFENLQIIPFFRGGGCMPGGRK